jgi:hypothetical protein
MQCCGSASPEADLDPTFYFDADPNTDPEPDPTPSFTQFGNHNFFLTFIHRCASARLRFYLSFSSAS